MSMYELTQIIWRRRSIIADVVATTATAARSQRLAAAAADVLISSVKNRYQLTATAPADQIMVTLLVAARAPGADSNHTARQVALVAVGALLVAIAFAVA